MPDQAFRVDPELLVPRCHGAFAAKQPYESTWEAIRRGFLPDAPPFALRNTTQGQRDREAVVDTYGQFLLRQSAIFDYGAIVNGDGDWIKVVASAGRDEFGQHVDPDPEILDWCDWTRDELTEVLMSEETGFTEQFLAMLMERRAFGTGILYAGDRPGGLPIVRAVPLADSALEGGAGHEPGGFWWRQSLTAGEWARKFPGRDLGQKITEAANSETRRNDRFVLTHGCIENPGWVPAEADQVPTSRRYLTVWLNEDEKRLVNRAWLTSDPYTAFRAPRRAGEQYGRGSANEALEENQMAQRVRVSTIRGMEKVVDPTMILPDDGVMTPPTNEAEGAIVVRAELLARAGDPIRYMQSTARPDLGQEFLRDGCYQSMERAFGADQMRLPREPRMVESQILGLQEEQSRAIVPMVAPIFAPLGRFIGRIYDIRRRQGRMPRPPQNGRSYQLSIEFRNPLEKASRLAEVRAFTQVLAILGQAIAVDPGARHALKVVKGVQQSARTLGIPESWIATEKEIEAALAASAELAKQREGMERALDLSTMLKNAGAGAKGFAPANDREAA